MGFRLALKQLEFAFPRHVVHASRTVAGQAVRLPNVVAASLCEARRVPQGRDYRRRDHALESRARELLCSLGAHKLAREIRVEWNPRLKTCAGRADYREKLISLNPLLRNLNDELGQTKFNAPKLECKKHSTPVHHPVSRDVRDNLECKMHSSLTSEIGSAPPRSKRQEVVRDEIDRTLRHELAHLLAQWRVGRRRIAPHGTIWRQACRDLGIADETRCHNLPFATKVYLPRYVYRCQNCRRKFPRIRRIRRAIACLACCRRHNRGEFDPRFRLRLIKSQQKETKETKDPKHNSSFALLSSV